ncbi:MAG TPA: hypothetical protein VK688_06955, partial [Gemmatimonadales bacterium]|nr:hypothetical protein [Gemmatimonadales bacterium]
SLTPRQRECAITYWTRHRDWVAPETYRQYQVVARQIIDRLVWSPRLERFLTARLAGINA